MVKRKSIRRYNRQILALIEKNIFIDLRFKANFISQFLNPIIQLFVLLFIFGLIFNIKKGYSIGYWNASNYVLFLLIAFCIQFSRSIINRFNTLLFNEKYWKTLSAIMVAPVNRFTFLIGILFSELAINGVVLVILFLIAWIFYPISIFFIFLTLLVFFSILLIFTSIGLLIGAFAISNEELMPYFSIGIKILFLFSCINYPRQIFPEIIQFFVMMNPFYYLFDLLRLTWYLGVNYKAASSLISPIHIITITLFTILAPIFSIYIFNKVFKKYGITGY